MKNFSQFRNHDFIKKDHYSCLSDHKKPHNAAIDEALFLVRGGGGHTAAATFLQQWGWDWQNRGAGREQEGRSREEWEEEEDDDEEGWEKSRQSGGKPHAVAVFSGGKLRSVYSSLSIWSLFYSLSCFFFGSSILNIKGSCSSCLTSSWWSECFLLQL